MLRCTSSIVEQRESHWSPRCVWQTLSPRYLSGNCDSDCVNAVQNLPNLLNQSAWREWFAKDTVMSQSIRRVNRRIWQ